MNSSSRAAVYVSEIIGQAILDCYIPERHPESLHITVRDRHDPSRYKDIRFCNIHAVELDGQTLSWSAFSTKQWITPNLRYAVMSTLGEITDASFHLSTRGSAHLKGKGEVSMRLALDEYREHMLTAHCREGDSFIKLM